MTHWSVENQPDGSIINSSDLNTLMKKGNGLSRLSWDYSIELVIKKYGMKLMFRSFYLPFGSREKPKK